jgi:hypothetical protein
MSKQISRYPSEMDGGARWATLGGQVRHFCGRFRAPIRDHSQGAPGVTPEARAVEGRADRHQMSRADGRDPDGRPTSARLL